MSGFGKFKKDLLNKEEFYRSLAGRKTIHKECQHFINVSNKLEKEKK